MPFSMNCMRGDFGDLPIGDAVADVVFAWEVLDHALTNNHFNAGVRELCRVLKPGGLMFFNHPLHDEPKPGHTVIKTKEDIIDSFKGKGLCIVEKKVINNEMKKVPENHKELCVVFKKSVPNKRIPDDVAALITELGGETR